ncbi:MAG: sulfatase-like hydrolase/transferase [Planctomycetes bacterium]|nr:sulfatase-like hydrolase/transferase [Planctomycetota bacterium]
MSARPNILLVFTDQQRFDTIQALGSSFAAETPNMDFLAEHGVSFDNCTCTAPICSPSRACMMTGLFPSQAGMPGNLYSPCPSMNVTIPTMGNLFRNAGYETMYHGKWHLGADVKEYGFEHGEECSLDEETRIMASRIWRDRDWCANERPFMHVVSLMNPHDVYFYDPDKKVENFKRPWKNINRQQDGMPDLSNDRRSPDWEESRWGSYFEWYAEQIELVDADLGKLLNEFKCSGFYNNSWIIFTTDHGDMAGEHDIAFKGPYMYDGVVRIPMIAIPPMTRYAGADRAGQFHHDIQPGRRDTVCSNLDLLPTMLDIAGIDIPANLLGKSLLPIIKNESNEEIHDYSFAEWHNPPLRMIRNTQWKYIKALSGPEELYDLQNDPDELHNLINDANASDALETMRQHLADHITNTSDPFYELDKHEFIFDPAKNNNPGTLNQGHDKRETAK